MESIHATLFCGLGVEPQAVTTTPEAFLHEFEYTHDEPDSSAVAAGRESTRGVSPLFLAVVSGNVKVTCELVRANPVDVTARLKSDFPALYMWVGCEPIRAAAAFCVTNHVAITTTLLEGGADPNAAAGKVGMTPLYAAAVTHNLEGVQALISAAGDRLKIEKGNRVVSDTALGAAVYLGTPAIVDSLLAANAEVAHVSDFGATKLMSACENPFATPDMLASLCRDGTTGSVCHRRWTRTCFWALILRLFEMAVWLRVLSSDFAMGMAHTRGSTALHAAARHGHTSLVRWLLNNGARKSLQVKNVMGCTPLDVAQVFGPFPETEALLIQAVLGDEFDARYVIQSGGRLSSRQRPRGGFASWSTSSRSIPSAPTSSSV